MDFTVEIKVSSIQFLVEGGTDDGALDFIDKVSVWDGKKYREIDFDSDIFIKHYGDVLIEAIEEQERDRKIWAAEQRLDAKREEGIL